MSRVLTVETHFAGQVYPGDRREVIAYMEEVILDVLVNPMTRASAYFD